jgi:hypothetical protein
MTYITEIYCESQKCNARESKVVTTDYGDNPEPKAWRCPACGTKAKVHWKLPLAAYEKERRDNEARIRRLRNWR